MTVFFSLSFQTFSELYPSVEQIPVGYELSGVVSKGRYCLGSFLG